MTEKFKSVRDYTQKYGAYESGVIARTKKRRTFIGFKGQIPEIYGGNKCHK
jgi:hypothetical protein